MTEKLEQLERLVEQEAGILAALDAPPLRPAAAARTRAAVRAEALRWRRAGRRWQVWARRVGAAAVVALAVGFTYVMQSGWPGGRSAGQAAVSAEVDDLLAAWDEALGQSSRRFAFLLGDGWLVENAETEGAPWTEGAVDGLDWWRESWQSVNGDSM